MRWIWIDHITEYEPGRRLVAIKNVTRAEEPLADHFEADEHGPARAVMPGSLILEGFAQTAGILVGTLSRFREKVILAKIADARIEQDVAPGQTIRYEAHLDRADTSGAATHGTIHRLIHPATGWEPIGGASMMFSLLDRNLSGLVFPEENFVFGENFKVLLRDSGLGHLLD